MELLQQKLQECNELERSLYAKRNNSVRHDAVNVCENEDIHNRVPCIMLDNSIASSGGSITPNSFYSDMTSDQQIWGGQILKPKDMTHQNLVICTHRSVQQMAHISRLTQ